MESRNRSSLLCPNCRRLVSRQVGHCPYCGLKSPGAVWKHTVLARGLSDGDLLIKILIGANVLMFVLSLLLSQGLGRTTMNPFSFFSPSQQGLFLLGATGTLPIGRFDRWWTLLAANYLHGGLLHIFFNMIALKQLGPLIIQEYGGHRMFALYTLSGVAGFFVSLLAGVPFTIGASASVCGLIGAALYFGKSRGGHYGQAVYSQIGGWAIGLFVFGFFVPNINNWGHGGGMAAGALLGLLLGYSERRRESFLDKQLAWLCVVATVLVLCWGVGTGFFLALAGN